MIIRRLFVGDFGCWGWEIVDGICRRFLCGLGGGICCGLGGFLLGLDFGGDFFHGWEAEVEADGFGEVDGIWWGDEWAGEDFLGDACEGGGLDEVGAAAGCQDEGVALVGGDFIGGGVDGFVGVGDLG